MKNKKLIMFFAALMILIFHLWIYINPITNNLFKIEVFIRTICYIGVDIFFFVSAKIFNILMEVKIPSPVVASSKNII